MAKISQQIEEEIAQNHLLPQYVLLCNDECSQLRKTCAENIGDICNAIGSSKAEEILVRSMIFN